MAPKVAKGKAKGKAVLKAVGKQKVLGKKKAKAKGKAPPEEEFEDTELSEETSMAIRNHQRNFKTALKSAPPHVQKVIEDIAKLGFGQNKRAKYAEAVLAWSKEKWEHSLFKSKESLSQTKKSSEDTLSYPQAIMIGMCGGAASFQQGLSDGDIEEVTSEAHPGRKFYRFVALKESTVTGHKKKLKAERKKGLEDHTGAYCSTALEEQE